MALLCLGMTGDSYRNGSVRYKRSGAAANSFAVKNLLPRCHGVVTILHETYIQKRIAMRYVICLIISMSRFFFILRLLSRIRFEMSWGPGDP